MRANNARTDTTESGKPRKKDVQWNVTNDDGSVPDWQRVEIAVLMDIRDELKRMNAVLNCPNFLDVPQILRRIRGNASRIKRT